MEKEKSEKSQSHVLPPFGGYTETLIPTLEETELEMNFKGIYGTTERRYLVSRLEVVLWETEKTS